MVRHLIDLIKNIPGWRTNRKLVAIAVDDYGNVRLHSKKAREQMDEAGLKVHSRFDAYDTLETREDLEALYEVLESVKDKNGKPAVFTPFALSCNPNFEEMEKQGYKEYIPEELPTTYEKLESLLPRDYQGARSLWKRGIDRGIMQPEYHGREHLNLKAFNIKLAARDAELLSALSTRSVTSLSGSGLNHIGWTAAFSFQGKDDYGNLKGILADGVQRFERVYGYKASCFTPPAQQFPPELEPFVAELGIKAIDRPFFSRTHLGAGKYQRKIRAMRRLSNGTVQLVRNVVFEPTDSHFDHVAKAMNQISAAFFWRKPVIISSHRVNFCGLIDENNRKKGLRELKRLLDNITGKWPDVEFVGMRVLTDMIADVKKGRA